MTARNDEAGGCQCGRIRYVATVDSGDAYLCHCTMCRHATGGVAAAFVNVPLDRLTWESEPDWYRSSPIAERPFCRSCGTPLGFRFVDAPANIDITVGSFDDPAFFRPTRHFGSESILPAWLDTSHLPVMRTDANPNVVGRWQKAGIHVPD